jgi:hypothetical protein
LESLKQNSHTFKTEAFRTARYDDGFGHDRSERDRSSIFELGYIAKLSGYYIIATCRCEEVHPADS